MEVEEEEEESITITIIIDEGGGYTALRFLLFICALIIAIIMAVIKIK